MRIEEDVTLSTGRVIIHRESKLSTGGVEALIKDDEAADMTETEWQEYCGVIISRAAKGK